MGFTGSQPHLQLLSEVWLQIMIISDYTKSNVILLVNVSKARVYLLFLFPISLIVDSFYFLFLYL